MILLWISLNSLLFDHLINQIKLQIVKPILRGQRWYTKESSLIRQVTSWKKFNSYEVFYARKRKMWPFNKGDCMSKFDCIRM
jgi:hypothetical protein